MKKIVVNTITCTRFPLGLLALYAVYYEYWILAATAFSIGLATDWIDGALARKLKAETKFGAEVLEPVADTFLLLCGFIGMVAIDLIPWWTLVVVIIGNRILDWGVRPHIDRPNRILWFEAIILEGGAFAIAVFLLWQVHFYAGIGAICVAPIIAILKRKRIVSFTCWCWR